MRVDAVDLSIDVLVQCLIVEYDLRILILEVLNYFLVDVYRILLNLFLDHIANLPLEWLQVRAELLTPTIVEVVVDLLCVLL